MENIRVRVNGRPYEDRVNGTQLLVHYLRDVRGLTGTALACDTSRCGACMVLMDDLPVLSCTLLAVQANEARIETIEGVEADGEHALRRALREEGAEACAECIAGRIIVADALLRLKRRPMRGEVVRALEGNRCSCSMAESFVHAVLRVAGGT